MARELKQCPFCGGEAKIEEKCDYNDGTEYSVNHYFFQVICQKCFARSQRIPYRGLQWASETNEEYRKNKELKKIEVIDVWNNRVSEALHKDKIEKIKEECLRQIVGKVNGREVIYYNDLLQFIDEQEVK